MTITDAMQPIEQPSEDTFYVKLAEATQKIIDDALVGRDRAQAVKNIQAAIAEADHAA